MATNLFGEDVGIRWRRRPRLRFHQRPPWSHPLQPQLPRMQVPKPRGSTDMAMCERARAGDVDAEAIMIKRWRRLADFAGIDCKVRGMDREDVVAVALIALTKAVRSYKTESLRFEAYARLLIQREVISSARKGKRVPLTAPTTPEAVEDSVRSPEADVDADVAETCMDLAEFSKSLSACERQLLSLRLQEKEQAEIEAIMGIGRATATALLKGLREKAGAYLDVDESLF